MPSPEDRQHSAVTETEIRFALTAPLAERLQRHYLADAAGVSERNETVYYDTSDRWLWRHGAELRVRENAKGIRQTVKYRARESVLFARHEAEVDLAVSEPDLGHLRQSVPGDLAAMVDGMAFEPVFRVSVDRTKALVRHGGAQLELAYDRGRISAGPKSLDLHEVELELKDGSDADLAEAALAFLVQVPAGLQTLGKAARGYQLATGGKPEPVFQDKQPIPADTVLPDAIAMMMRSAIAQVLANQAAVSATDAPEAVHQMRVGLRRLRSIVAAFRPVLDLSAAGNLLKETKRFFALLGDVREADVFLTETIDIFPQSQGGEERNALLEREVERFRKQARERMIDYAAGPEFARLALGWHYWIEAGDWLRNEQPLDRLLQTRPVAEFAAGRLQSLTRKLLKRGHHALTGTVDDWHEARIAAKKLRYAGGPLLAVVDNGSPLEGTAKASRRATRRLARLQDELGRFNDLSNVSLLLDRVAASVPGCSGPAFAVAAAYCSGWCDAQVQHAIPRLESTWQAFEAAMKGPA